MTLNLSSAPAAFTKRPAPSATTAEAASKRQEVKVLLRRLMRDNPNIENSIFRSIHAVSLDTMPGYKVRGCGAFLPGAV